METSTSGVGAVVTHVTYCGTFNEVSSMATWEGGHVPSFPTALMNKVA